MSNSFKFFPSLCDTFKSDHKRILQNVLNFKFVPKKGKSIKNEHAPYIISRLLLDSGCVNSCQQYAFAKTKKNLRSNIEEDLFG